LAIQYDFSERLQFSEGISNKKDIKEILLTNISGAVSISKASLVDDRNGTDYYVTIESGKKLSIDVKVREKDFSQIKAIWDDLALETWSVVEDKVVGWTRNSNKQTDYVLWFWQDTGRWCLVPFLMLCTVYKEYWKIWKKRYKTELQKTTLHGRMYHSECTFVPRHLVWKKIYERYS